MTAKPFIVLRSHRAAIAAACALVLGASTAATRAMDILVPSYFDPTDSAADWTRMANAATRVSLTAIMNPNSGPGAGVDSGYIGAISSMHASGGRVIGYVSTDYTNRTLANVEADVDRYLSWYPNLDGIFFDEMTDDANATHVNYYATLYSYVKSKGATLRVVTNPGISVAQNYFTTTVTDTVCTFESNTGYAGATPPAWTTNYPAARFYNLPYNVATSATMLTDLSLAQSRRVGNIYVTDDSGANPWDTLPSYWDAEVNGVLALTPTWNVNASGNWNAAAQWSTNSVPNGAGATAKLFGITTSATTVFTNSAVTLGTLSFNNGQTYVVAGAGSLTMDVTAVNDTPMIEVLRGSHTINLPLRLNDSTSVFIAAGARLTIADPVTLAAGAAINKTGGGQLFITSTVGSPGGVATLHASDGTIDAAGDLGRGASVAADHGGAVVLRAPQDLASVEASSGGAIHVAANRITVRSLMIDNTARLDLGGAMIVHGAADRLAEIRSSIAQARNGGAWDGNGITSSTASQDASHATTLGSMTGAQFTAAHGAGSTLADVPIAANDLLVGYAYYGDADLSGDIAASDYVRLEAGFATGASDWLDGDFDADGTVNVDDYALIDLAYNDQEGTLARATAWIDGTDRSTGDMNRPALSQVVSHYERFGQAYAASLLAAVPEPATPTVGIIGLSLLIRRGRRSAGSEH